MSNILLSKKVHDADREDAKRWDALPFHDEDDMSYFELGSKWRNRKNGKRIASLMLLNFKELMPAQKKKAQLSLRLQLNMKVSNHSLNQKETIFNDL